ncbi:ribonuclease P protein component [Novosphingobium sp. SG919]|uniref:ribonuclease P protein component n=1 Tax=Novosphingobium rhizosphaerae TaxID=1551649 RepID=UPI00249E930C|nr:ribonuclease P protein component [Novosphingobium sp. SG919]
MVTIARRADFLAANRGIRVARPGFVLLVNPLARADGSLRFGVTVTKKIGNAVVRNRMKRRFRALLRDLLPSLGIAGADHVLIGRENGVERDFALLRSELVQALARAAAGKGDPPRKPGNRPGGKSGGKNAPRTEPKPAYGR